MENGILQRMKRVLWTAVWLLMAGGVTAGEPLFVTAAEWAQPRTGTALLQHPALAQAMAELHDGQTLQLLYPGGDEGSLWARELQAWLVALGLSSQRIELLPGSTREDAIELRVSGVAQ
ncbi:hypothetical protein [Sulfurivermis fontis]|uniref:hypothetical protein n=1 Tax=Sulfurivermis fontis TaxID=1972068 RepID=UPI000FD6F36F|nr:hypothetical protein [Sulfurivermis fontis]